MRGWWRNWGGGGNKLKFGSAGDGGAKYISSSLGGHIIKCQILLGDMRNWLHFGKMLLAFGGLRPQTP